MDHLPTRVCLSAHSLGQHALGRREGDVFVFPCQISGVDFNSYCVFAHLFIANLCVALI